jgi:hypothetical protein
MSKIEELSIKYSNVNKLTFNKFVNSDKTPTKKYLEYMLSSWSNKNNNYCPGKTDELVELVNNFDKLIPYIENKDIYHPYYKDLRNLKIAVGTSEQIREEKTFNREEHSVTLFEDDNYLFIRPTTHKGSAKYGANTKWCTAGKNNKKMFDDYTKSGLLVYLLDKKGTKNDYGKKLAFYMKYQDNSLRSEFSVFNVIDSVITDETIMNYGWTFDELSKMFYIFRSYHKHSKDVVKAKNKVQKISDFLASISFDELNSNLQILGANTESYDFKDLEESINGFKLIMNKVIKNGFTKTES